MKDLILKYGGEDMVKLISNQTLNNVVYNGSYIINDVSGSINLPNDPDTNKEITGGAAVRVIANDDHTKISQELIELSKGYKYVRSSNDGKTWVPWSVLTPFS